jgi:hypothetical protein
MSTASRGSVAAENGNHASMHERRGSEPREGGDMRCDSPKRLPCRVKGARTTGWLWSGSAGA